MLKFMCRDTGDTSIKVSCCVEPSWCFKNSYFDAIMYQNSSAPTISIKKAIWPENDDKLKSGASDVG